MWAVKKIRLVGSVHRQVLRKHKARDVRMRSSTKSSDRKFAHYLGPANLSPMPFNVETNVICKRNLFIIGRIRRQSDPVRFKTGS